MPLPLKKKRVYLLLILVAPNVHPISFATFIINFRIYVVVLFVLTDSMQKNLGHILLLGCCLLFSIISVSYCYPGIWYLLLFS